MSASESSRPLRHKISYFALRGESSLKQSLLDCVLISPDTGCATLSSPRLPQRIYKISFRPKLREAKGHSQKKLAKLSTEACKNQNPTPDALKKIARVFEMSIDDLTK